MPPSLRRFNLIGQAPLITLLVLCIGTALFTEKMSDFVSRHYIEEDDEHYGACDLRGDHSDLRAPLNKFLPHLPHLPSSLPGSSSGV